MDITQSDKLFLMLNLRFFGTAARPEQYLHENSLECCFFGCLEHEHQKIGGLARSSLDLIWLIKAHSKVSRVA